MGLPALAVSVAQPRSVFLITCLHPSFLPFLLASSTSVTAHLAPISQRTPPLIYLPIIIPPIEPGGNHWNGANHLLAEVI